MTRDELKRMLPQGMADFNAWEAAIPKYRTPLMRRLDGLDLRNHPQRWTRSALYEIVLWELNRYPEIDDELFAAVGELAELRPGEHRRGREVFGRLLACRNVGLTMATAIMRFANPEVFQTLNARNGFVVMGGREAPPEKDSEALAEYYFDYLDELRKLTGDGFDFRYADRMLYQADKASGRALS